MSGRRSRRTIPPAERTARRRGHARVCVSCRRVRPKAEMIRIVRDADGDVAVDPSARKPGRGAYVCPEAACLSLAGRRLAGALPGGRLDPNAIRTELEKARP